MDWELLRKGLLRMRRYICALFRVLRPRPGCAASALRLGLLLNLCAIATSAQPFLLAPSPGAPIPNPESSELFFEGYISNAVFKFAGGEVSSMIYYGGVEYDKHNPGTYASRAGRFWDAPPKLLHARLSYVFEVLPLDLIRQPIHTDYWGDAIAPGRKTNPGIAISPLGFRWIWRDGKALRPLWTVKLGEALFAEKALATNASYENFTVNSAIGFEARLSETTDLRLGYAYQHVSNAYTNADPGLDTVGPSFGIVYHLPASSKW
jgi:hypothetical protein